MRPNKRKLGEHPPKKPTVMASLRIADCSLMPSFSFYLLSLLPATPVHQQTLIVHDADIRSACVQVQMGRR